MAVAQHKEIKHAIQTTYKRKGYGAPKVMLQFRLERSLQKFASINASIFNHFNMERHLISRDTFKVQREATLLEWQQLCAA